MNKILASSIAALALAAPAQAAPSARAIAFSESMCNQAVQRGQIANSQRAFNACVRNYVSNPMVNLYADEFCDGMLSTLKPEKYALAHAMGYGFCFQ